MFGKRISTRYVKSTILQLLNPIYLATTDSTLLPWPGDTSFRFWSVVAAFLLSQGFNAESTMQNTAFLSLRRLSNFAALLLTFARTLLHSLVKETFFSSPVTQRTDPAHWGRTNVAEVVFHEPVFAALFVVEQLVAKIFFPKASLAVSLLIYDGLTFQIRAPETTLTFYKHDLHKYHYTQCEHSSSFYTRGHRACFTHFCR